MSLTPDIERVLSEHELTYDEDYKCGKDCPWSHVEPGPWKPGRMERLLAAHRLHLAEQIAALVEQRVEAARREALLGAARELDKWADDTLSEAPGLPTIISLANGYTSAADRLRDRAGGES